MVQSFDSNLEDLYPSFSAKLGKVVLNIISGFSDHSHNLLLQGTLILAYLMVFWI